MSVVHSAKAYLGTARTLSRYWGVSFAWTLARMCASRVLYSRGPAEFDKYRFVGKPLSAWKTFVSNRELSAMERANTPAEFLYLDEDKAAFAAHCVQAGLPTPEVIAVTAAMSGKKTRPTAYPIVSDGEELSVIVRSRGDFDGFAKPRCGGIGWGSFAFSARGGIITTKDGTGDAHDLFARCASSAQSAEGYILQVRARQHPSFAQWMPGPALGTMRVLTFLQPNGDVVVPRAALKMPAPDAEADNIRLGALQAGINVVDGTLGPAIGQSRDRPVTHAMDRNPHTHAQITGEAVPYWVETKELVTRGARAFDMLPALGWDVGVTDQGPMLIEANVMFGVPDVPYERGLAQELRTLFAQVARK